MAAAAAAVREEEDEDVTPRPLRAFCVIYHDKQSKEWPYWCEARHATNEDEVWRWLFLREFRGMWQRAFNEDRKLWWPDEPVVQCSAADPNPHQTCYVAMQCDFGRDPANVDVRRLESYFVQEQKRDPTLARIKACLQAVPRVGITVVPVGGRPSPILDN